MFEVVGLGFIFARAVSCSSCQPGCWKFSPDNWWDYGASDWAFSSFLNVSVPALLIHLKNIHCIQERDFT